MRTFVVFLFIILVGCSKLLHSQQLVHHTTNWFGPNANPIPSFTDATLPIQTRVRLMGDYYKGKGDHTKTAYFEIEVPVVSERVSVKAWMSFEHFLVSDSVKELRGMVTHEGYSMGDVYLQSRFRLFKEKDYVPAILLNVTLKTASGSQFKNRRYFNTAGYYFDLEIGKSLYVDGPIIREIRWVANSGFFSWDVQTPGLNVQDDALMYGGKLILSHKKFTWENTIAGYSGWIDRHANYGNKPLSFTSAFTLNLSEINLILQYQHGIRYFPYDQYRIGIDVPIKSLTPTLP